MIGNLTPAQSLNLVEGLNALVSGMKDKSILKKIEDGLKTYMDAAQEHEKRESAVKKRETEAKKVISAKAQMEAQARKREDALDEREQGILSGEMALKDKEEAFEKAKKKKMAEMNKRLRELQASQTAADKIVKREAALEKREAAAKDYEDRYRAKLAQFGLVEAA